MGRDDHWSHVCDKARSSRTVSVASLGSSTSRTLRIVGGSPPELKVTLTDTPRWTAQPEVLRQELVRRGVLFSGSKLLSLAHSDQDVARMVDPCREAMRVLRVGIDLQAVDALTQGVA